MTDTQYPLTDTRVTFHRNGISGIGFHLVTFRHGPERMMAVVFDADSPGRECYTAVLMVDNLYADPSPLSVFQDQSVRKFRGDYFDAELLRIIREATDAYDVAFDEQLKERAAR
jgi:hypothetical protein